MKLYNSKRNKIEDFVPIEPGKVSMYVCGPTVYNHPHIGNARPIVVFDLLRRILTASGYEVTMISNFTDIDDKIIAKAQEESVDESVIASRYIKAYNKVREDLNAGNLSATPYATDSIDAIISFIENLIDKDHAYVVNGDVYFSVNSISSYGEISTQNIDNLMVGARIDANDNKRNPLDFALWKVTNDDGVKWDSPWGMGRPGWHTECVVMIQNYFKKEVIDIHGGGQDLKFPHHENESAQCKAIHNHDLANYWVHNAMLNLDGAKMSKSLGNVQWAKDYIETLGSNLTRWLLLSTHYRLTLNITDEVIESSRTELQKIEQAMLKTGVELQLNYVDVQGPLVSEFYTPFLEALQDDMNVANAKVYLFDIIKNINQSLRVKDKDWNRVGNLYFTLIKMLDVLGIALKPVELTLEDRELFKLWVEAKSLKDFDKADILRNKLTERGLI